MLTIATSIGLTASAPPASAQTTVFVRRVTGRCEARVPLVLNTGLGEVPFRAPACRIDRFVYEQHDASNRVCPPNWTCTVSVGMSAASALGGGRGHVDLTTRTGAAKDPKFWFPSPEEATVGAECVGLRGCVAFATTPPFHTYPDISPDDPILGGPLPFHSHNVAGAVCSFRVAVFATALNPFVSCTMTITGVSPPIEIDN